MDRRMFVIAACGALLVGPTTPGIAQAAGQPFASTAVGTVFVPNPVQQLGLQTLTDDNDSDYLALSAAYRRMTLTNLDTSGSLTGAYVTVKSATGKPAMSTAGVFPDWHRDSDQFEQVMGYYWVTTAQAYLQQLGFGSRLRPVNQRQIELRINQFGGDNSFFRDDKANITLGKGGVDDAEDAEVVIHEYGHSVQEAQVPGFGTNLESGAIGEGFGDYLAVVVSSWGSGVPSLVPEACVADWDSVSYTRTVPHCLRRLDGTKLYPQDIAGEVHADGEIWSRALWDIRTGLGDTKATTVIVEAQFAFAPDTSFHDAARATVDAAQRLYGTQPARTVEAAFVNRGIL